MRRQAFTLVEILVTLAIIAILAGAAVVVIRSVQRSARDARTRTLITTINQLLIERFSSYQTRRVSVDPAYATADPKKDRLNAIRRLMQLEMPDRWMEVESHPYTPLATDPPIRSIYKNRKLPTATPQYETAELLYLVITIACGDGESLEQINSRHIGDKDGDGMKEFRDGWENPIGWLRWPAGFVSELQPLSTIEKSKYITVSGPRETMSDHDPFDPFRSDQYAYHLRPLIYSSGSDGDFGIVTSRVDEDDNRLPPYPDPWVYPEEPLNDGTGAIKFTDVISPYGVFNWKRVPTVDPDTGETVWKVEPLFPTPENMMIQMGRMFDGSADNPNNHLLWGR